MKYIIGNISESVKRAGKGASAQKDRKPTPAPAKTEASPDHNPGECTRRGCLGPDPCEWAWVENGAYICLKDGHRLPHPDDLPPLSAYDRQEIDRWEQQRAELGLDPELSWIYRRSQD